MPATDGTWRVASRDAWNGRWIDRAVVTSVFMALGLGAFLVIRRAIGAIATPLPPLPLVATAVGLAGWTVCIRAIWGSQLTVKQRSLHALLAIWLPALTILFFAVGCSYPGRRMIDWLAWSVVAMTVGFSTQLLGLVRHNSPRIARRRPAGADGNDPPIQQLARYRAADGTQSIHGTLLAEFDPGERSTTLYVAFCPPFEKLPNVEVQAVDDSCAAVSLSQRLHNGVQIDVRLPQPADHKQCITVELIATEYPP